MNLSKSDLLSPLSETVKVCGRRQTLPILSCVRLESNGKQLEIRASDLDQELSLLVPCDGKLEALCVSGAKLLQVCAGAGDSVEFKAKDGKLLVSGGFSASLGTLKAEEFPPTPSGKFVKQGINCADLSKAIKAVEWAASTDKTRYVINSVHVKLEPKRMMAESADGANMARYCLPAIGVDCSFVLPSECVARFCFALEQEGAVLSASENHVNVEFDSGSYSCKLVEGQYPNFDNIICKNEVKALGEFDAAAVAPSLQTCLALCPDNLTPSVTCELDGDGWWIGSTFKADDQFETQIPGKFEPCKFGLNAQAMARCLAAFNGGKVKLYTMPVNTALVLEQGNLTVYTMPLRET